MDTSKILTDLRTQRDRIHKAIEALEALDSTAAQTTRPTAQPQLVSTTTKGKRTLSPEARKRLSLAAKRRWAAAKKGPAQPQAGAERKKSDKAA